MWIWNMLLLINSIYMKFYNLLAVLVIFLAAGCNQQKSDDKTLQHETATGKESENLTGGTLTLNDGKKWKLDEPTRENIRSIKQTFEGSVSAGQDYETLAKKLQVKSNKLVSECKMSGKDHDMLHLWLTDYLSALKDLNSSEPTKQEASFHKIEEQLKSFEMYFE